MTSGPGDSLRARMAQLLDRELVERASARAGVRAGDGEMETPIPESEPEFGIGDRLARDVWRIAAAALRMPEDQLDPQENLANLGVDSIAITEIMVQISRHYGISVAPTTFFEAKHLDDLSTILLERYGSPIEAHYAAKDTQAEVRPDPEPMAPDEIVPVRDDPVQPEEVSREESWMRRHRAASARPTFKAETAAKSAARKSPPAQPQGAGKPQHQDKRDEAAPIAIVSMEGMFPQSPDLEAFEAHLAGGDDCIEEIPPERWDWRKVFGDPKKGAFTDVKYGGFVPGADRFDAGFFNISPREAELMDPQHRLFMECVWHLIEKGGYAPGSLAGRKIGLFLGINLLDYTDMVNRAGIMDAQQLTGLGHAFCPNRLSFLLDIHGPSEVVDTACSSSLVAIHRGVMSIRHEGCEMAIAGGSNLMLSPTQHIMFSKVGMITPDGRCKTFSKEANGYARADGVGAVLLKRLDLAERDGDPILGVIKGSVEHHGGGATSLTAPNPKAQARLIVEAHRQAGVDPRSIGLIECHGTGTPLGDPIEIEGLKLAFQELYRDWKLNPPEEPAIGLGSVKSNIGHAETAAGVAGLIKVLLAMKSGTLYRTLHCEEPNPLLELSASPFYLLQQSAPWKRRQIDGRDQPLRAGLSSFGAGGANVHLVIEEYSSAERKPSSVVRSPVVVPVSAKNEKALSEAVAQLRQAVETADLAEMACTLQTGRDAMRFRAAFVTADREDLIGRMDAFLAGDGSAAMTGAVPPGRKERSDPLDPTGREAADLANHWTSGGDVDWAALYGDDQPRRIALPGYAFQRKRYWLPETETASAPQAGSLSPRQEHPGTYRLPLTGDEVFLADHKVAGAPVLPGVAYLELVRAAAEQEGIANPLIRQVVWMAPLKVERPVEVACDLSRLDDGGARAEIFTLRDNGERLLHAQMRIAEQGDRNRGSVDLAALQEAPARHFASPAIYSVFDGMGLVYGPGHRVISDLAVKSGAGGPEVLARLDLPHFLEATLQGFSLHPSLLDGALQSAIGLALDAEGRAPQTAALPFSIEAVEILGPCEQCLWAHVRAGEAAGPGMRRMDIDLIAGDGSIRVTLRGFTTRAFEQAGEADILRFQPEWRPLKSAGTPEKPGRKIVCLTDGTVAADDLRQVLPEHDIRVLEDDSNAPLDRRYLSLAGQVMELAQAELSSGPVSIQLVLEGEPGRTPLAGLCAMFRSISREHPKIGGQVLSFASGTGAADLADHLRKADAAPSGACLKPDGNDLLMEVWDPSMSQPVQASKPWKSGGVYLITGGTGALGRLLAGEILGTTPGATVVLASRTAPDAPGSDWIAATPDLHHQTADLSDKDAVVRLVEEIRREHGKLDGVIHAAGVTRDEAFVRKTSEQLAAVLAPKVSGAVALDKAIGDAPLDFFVFYSSISGVTGNTGQADYAAANSFLDGFAEAREARRRGGLCHGRTVSIAWPFWKDGGMALDGAQEDLMRRTTGLVPMDTRTGINALYTALAGDAARVLITSGNADRIRRFVGGVFERTEAPGSPQLSTTVQPDTARSANLQRRVLASLVEAASAQLKVSGDDLDPDVELTEYGFDSIGFTQFANRLNDLFGLELTPTLFFEYPTLEGLAGYLSEAENAAMIAALGGEPETEEASLEAGPPQYTFPLAEPPKSQAFAEPQGVTEASGPRNDLVAIVGMSGQFPGAPDVEAFWDVLKEGRNTISEVPPERWDWRDYWGDPLSEPGKGNVKWGGFIEDIEAFDAPFFGVSAPEARMMDPQQRLLLTEAWRVMEDAGYAPSALAGSKTGVFIGTADTGYSRLIAEAGVKVEGYSMTGLAPSLGPNRISYFYDFHGPSVAVETACSSALIAVHRAVEAIRSGHCTAAIAGGINALLLPEAFVGFSKAGMLSPEGRCKPFSSKADGYARGEGVGLVFLKLLADAERDGDTILAVIRGSAENHGGHAASLTAPNPKAQADLIRTAYERSGIDPRTVGYIEAHGTGTPLGDPIEIEALTAAFADLDREAQSTLGPAPAQSCAIGSVKSNIGHLELAAGIAGLIKVLLQIRHGEIARSLFSEDLNPYLKLKGSPFHVAQKAETWNRATDAQGTLLPRRAGVSSFGFGGTNAHVVLQEYLSPDPSVAQSPPHDDLELIVLSAKSEAQLKEMAARLESYLSRPDLDADLADIAFTLQTARAPMEHRLAFPARSIAELSDRLKAYHTGANGPGIQSGTVKSGRKAISVLESDGPLREAAAGLVERGRADDLLALWTGGLSVDWTSVRKGRTGKRIPLPGYPFAKTHYWVGAVPPASTEKASGSDAVLTVQVDGSESYLRDHKVNGVKVLPGVMSFELLRRALEGTDFGSGAFELAGHTWTGAVSVETGPRQLQISLKKGAGEDLRYAIETTEGGGTIRHAEGVARRLKDSQAPKIDLEAVRSATKTGIDAATLYRGFEDLGLGYGPAQRAITGLWRGQGLALARLELPVEADTGLKLHPSILDGALQAVFGLPSGEAAEPALPYSARRVAVYGATAAQMWAVVRTGDRGTAIDLTDDLGNVVVRFEDFTVRRVPAPARASKEDRPPVVQVSEAERLERTLAVVTGVAARTLEVDPTTLDADTELGDFGFDSVSMTAFASRINSELGLALTPADFFEFATLARLAEHVSGDLSDEQLGFSSQDRSPPTDGETLSVAPEQPVPAAPRAHSASLDDDPIALVGLSCRFPMAEDADAFWSNLVTGRDCISRIPEDRWSWQELDGDPRQEPNKTNIHWGGFIDGVFDFDPLFFGISPREARLMDPQQRLMLTHAWKAIEDAGHSPQSLAGKKVGVFAGTSSSGYREMIGEDSGGEGYVATGAVPSVGPNRISYLLDLHGPSEPVETACSSSLVALHRAVQAIRAGDCDMALVGGVNTIITPEAHINFAKAGMLSADGRCKTFSAQANGYVRGEGAGMLFVRRLSDAERDGDPIQAVVRGTAINHGGHANSLTAPNTQAQADLLKTAYANADIDPRTVGYVEAHGTGTALGDPVEINALKSAFRSLPKTGDRFEETGCGLGSVKTNIGHLELAAGVAGVIKVLKQFEHKKLAPSLHCDEINPYIDLSGSPFQIVREARDWQPVRDQNGAPLPLRAGVSSFGFGGVNAHAILDEYRSPERRETFRPERDGPVIVVLSARDTSRLKDSAGNLVKALQSGRFDDGDLGDLAFTLQIGRSEMAERLAVVASSIGELSARLTTFLDDGTAKGFFLGSAGEEAQQPETLSPAASPDEIARHWVLGGKVDWQGLNPGPHRRLRLPTYPFARDVYRAGKTVPQGANSQAVPNGFKTLLKADAFYLKDHQVRGKCILPGAMSLEIVCKAALEEEVAVPLPLILSDVSWRRPVEPEGDEIALGVRFTDGGDGKSRFRLTFVDGRDTEYMRGQIEAGTRVGRLPGLDIDSLRATCGKEHDPDWLYACYSALGIDYGPSFRAIRELRSGGTDVLARLEVPAAAEGDGESFLLHPSLVDAAFHAALIAFAGEDSAVLALPFGVDRFQVLRPTARIVWAHLRVRPSGEGIRKLDIDLADEDGGLTARIEGFSLRLVPDPAGGRQRASTGQSGSDGTDRSAVERYFIDLIARETEVEASAISLTAPLEDYGIDSVLILQLTDILERDFGNLPKTLFFEYQTLAALIGYFRENHGPRLAEVTGTAAPTSGPTMPLATLVAVKRGPVETNDPIAIIGLAGRYPGARTLEEFWQNLADGRDCVTEVPAGRWDYSRYFDPVRQPGKTTCKWGGFIDGHDRFDPMFFNISPREAEYLDPQERLFLECAWETLEDAGYTRDTVAPGGDAGVFVGVMWEEYQLYGPELTAAGKPATLSGSAASIANRVSYFLNFHGPSLALDSMCSSSLTAIHLACDSLRSGSCAVALAGGVNLTPHPSKFITLSQGRFLSSRGRCESFGEGGDGYVPAEGVGAVLLKPLSRAEADGDRIHGVILGSALNHGGKTNGYTVPNPAAQTAVIEKALVKAGVSPEAIGYVEAHGTGTSLGDPIEIAALTKVFGSRNETGRTCAIGSVKSNIGHAESAAGMAGLTKLLLQLKHGELVPSLHAERLNPNIDFKASPFRVQRALAPWQRIEEHGQILPRMAGLSSFGAGGSNAHFVVAEYLEEERPALPGGPAVYPFSARDPERLKALLQTFRARLDTLEDKEMPSVAFTLQEGREAFEDRLAIVADDKTDLAVKLDRALAGAGETEGVFRGRASASQSVLSSSTGLHEIAAGWTKGARVDWEAMRQGPKPRPVSLPTYPFAEDYCWLPEIAVQTTEKRPDRAPDVDPPLLFSPVWREKSAGNSGETHARDRLHVLCGIASVYPALALELKKSGAEVTVLEAPDGPVDERYGFHALRLFSVLKDLARKGCDKHVQVVVPFSGDDRLLEGLSGLLRSAAMEVRGLNCQLVAVDGAVGGLAIRLAQDIAEAAQRTEIRYRQGHRFVRDWRELGLRGERDISPWTEGGVYLLTGGAGGIGLHLAEAIAASGCRPSLWLTGRSSALKPDIERRLKGLEASGACVRYRPVDVTDPASVARLLSEIDETDGRLNGVFHGAGLTRDSLLTRKSEETFREVLAPKVTGLRVLDEVIGGRPIDFLAVFASASGALGNPGQSDYATANAFQDSFAAWRNAQVEGGSRQGRTVSIDWPYWRDGGMHMDEHTIAAMEKVSGVRPLETGPALAALKAVLTATEEDQVLVLDGDHDRLRSLMTPGDERARAAPVRADAEPVAVKRSEPAVASGDRDKVVAAIKSFFSRCLGIPEDRLGLNDTIDRFGVDSVTALEIVEALEAEFGSLPQTILFEFQTINRLADELVQRQGEGQSPEAGTARPPVSEPLPAVRSNQETAAGARDIAIIAVAGRYPGADTIEAFGNLLREGRDCVTEIPADRLELLPRYSERKGEPGASYCKWGAFLSGVDRFDADFFGYSSRLADLADPQERLFLETAWHLFERAGHTRDYLAEHYGKRVGVFVGSMYHQYPGLAHDPDAQALLSLSSYSGIANRTSFIFDLQGPSVAVDSMCSSGLQAVHQACQSLMSGECRLAVAGGVNLTIHPAKLEGLSRVGLVGSSSRSRAFAGGDGYLPAEGVGAVLLKPLSDALADDDRILAVIKGSLANHAGHSAGYAVPNVDAQVHLLEDSFQRAGIDPVTVGYVEAAATGAQVGDAVELRALSTVFSKPALSGGGISLGSVKTNLGHAEAASGLAQLTKVLLQFERGELFPSFVTGEAPRMFEGTPFSPQTELAPWPASLKNRSQLSRRAAISSFGAGGSNVHLILEEAPWVSRPGATSETGKPLLFPLSARTEEQLGLVRNHLAGYLRTSGEVSLDALSRTLRFGRETLDCAVVFVAASQEELLRKLEDPGFQEDETAVDSVERGSVGRRGPMLVLPGYPFKRERHWLTPKGAASAGKDLTETELPTVSHQPALRLIRETLAAELGRPVETIGADAGFGDMGVDSMALMRLSYAVEGAYGAVLTPGDVEAHPTPGRLAAFLENLGPAEMPTEVTGTATGPYRLPLGEAQKGLWVHQSLYPESGDYNVPLAFVCKSVDATALDKALDRLVSAYPVLATRIELENDDPVLTTRPERVEFRSVSLPKELETEAFLRQRAVSPLDLNEGVFRAEVISGGKLDGSESVVLLVTHHLVTDGVSSEVMTRDFWKAYAHFTGAAPLAESGRVGGADYSEFVTWESAFLRSDEGQAQKRYWLDRLSGPLPDPRLPVAGGFKGEGSVAGESLDLRLPKELSEALAETARRRQIGAASLYLTAFALLLYRYSGDRDLVIGVPTVRRPSRRFAETLGFCANVIALRLNVAADLGAASLAEKVHAELREGLAHSDYPFAAIARDLGGTATGDTPYRVTFAYQSFGQALAAQESFATGDVRLLPEIRQVGDTRLGIEVRNEPEGALLLANYDGNSFDRPTMERLLQHYRRLLEALVNRGDATVSTLPMLTRAEEDRALHHWSRSRRAEVSGIPVHERILEQAKRSPSAIAVSAEGRRSTYRQLVARSARIAQTLQKRGVGRGDRVAVLLGREPDAIAALIGVVGIGAVWVPLDPEFPDERLAFILKDTGAAAVLTGERNLKRLQAVQDVPPHVVDLSREGRGLRDRFTRFPTTTIHAEDPAYMIYTSGSTGRPKGVVVSHGALSGHCEIIAGEYGLSAKDIVLQFAPASVDTAIEQILPILTVGGRLELRPEGLQTPEAFRSMLEERRVTVADLPPVYLHELLRAWESQKTDLSGLALRLTIVGGEALTSEVVDLWGRSGLADRQLLNAYGPTEATITALVHTVKPSARERSIPIGRPLPGTEIYILDRDGNPVPDTVVGELHIGGDRLAEGYRNRADLTKEKFRLHRIGGRTIRLYSTGDLACFRANSGGIVEFHGRVDGQVKLRGHRIELGEVEAAIAACGVAEVAVLLERNKAGESVLAAYLGEDEKTVRKLELRKRLSETLPAHMLPTVWVCLGSLPKTAGGKIDRLSLSRGQEVGSRESGTVQLPQDRLEEQLLEIWKDVLGIPSGETFPGTDVEFEAAGGHSLLSVRLLSRIEKMLGVDLSVSDLAAAGTIVEQARLLRRRGLSGTPPGETGKQEPRADLSLLVPLRQPEPGSESEKPLFLIHPVGGTLSCYRQMVEDLTIEAPVYGVRAEGLEPGEEPQAGSLEDLAARYCRQIRDRQPTGPYRLCGWSFGGVLAFEMARQLERAGAEVSGLVLIDSYLPQDLAGLEPAGADPVIGCKQAFLRDLFGIEAEISDDRDLYEIARGTPQFETVLPGGREDEFRRLYEVFDANHRLFLGYEPQRCDVPMVLIRATAGAEGDNHSDGWEALSAKPLTLHRVAADHFSVLKTPALNEWLPAMCQKLSGGSR
ncbi:non-ribosomal peptide synthetase [Roseibium aggregatum]|uniref:Amino acid adenylation domain-containing protein n=1 Tax=Roseibium aggregatum TaxID=187304 RepID=A0A939EDI3_9HYPH|nr:non-ribosomal peptide synthetase [Roseibium aggregatum]MBN9669609.1 amino acid adenylation domain-containing protein [Roseibium aggregatum]